MHRRKTIINIQKVSLIFFIITGIVHLGSSILRANELLASQATLLIKVMDIPFLITGLLYGISSLRLNLTDPAKEHKILDIISICVIILALVGLIILNLATPDLA